MSMSSGPVDPEWTARQSYWRRKLRRLRLEAEPIEQQVARYRRVTVALSSLAGVLALAFLALFGAFRRPDVGAVVVGVLLVPIAVLAWIDQAVLEHRARAYLRERDGRAAAARGAEGSGP